MSEKQAAVEVKQEGEFTLKGKSKPKKPKQLGNKEQEIQKVSIKEPLVEVEPDVKKVEIKNEEIDRLTNLAIDADGSYSHWWATGGFVVGAFVSLGIFYAALEASK